MERIEVKVCIGTTCHLFGSSRLLGLEKRLPEAWRARVDVGTATCTGLCDGDRVGRAPFATVAGRPVPRATPESVLAAIAEALGPDAADPLAAVGDAPAATPSWGDAADADADAEG